jgi:hypothetical protein
MLDGMDGTAPAGGRSHPESLISDDPTMGANRAADRLLAFWAALESVFAPDVDTRRRTAPGIGVPSFFGLDACDAYARGASSVNARPEKRLFLRTHQHRLARVDIIRGVRDLRKSDLSAQRLLDFFQAPSM